METIHRKGKGKGTLCHNVVRINIRKYLPTNQPVCENIPPDGDSDHVFVLPPDALKIPATVFGIDDPKWNVKCKKLWTLKIRKDR
jgi:hypothetical protein